MKSYRVRRDEIAVIDHHGAHRVTQHWPLAARAWPPIAAPALPAEALSRLSVGKVELTLGTTVLVVMMVLLIGTIPGWPYSRGVGIRTERQYRTGAGHAARSLAEGSAMARTGSATARRSDHRPYGRVRAVNRR